MNHLHTVRGVVQCIVSIGLLLLGATGLSMWWRREQRWIGAMLLALGGGLSMTLIVWMRM
jgi:uncharacterized iron-regulated membrane protein